METWTVRVGLRARGPQDETVLVPAVREDVRVSESVQAQVLKLFISYFKRNKLQLITSSQQFDHQPCE